MNTVARGGVTEAVRARRWDAWSFLRNVLEQGRAIQMDNAAGSYESYELLSARVDAAARERPEELEAAMSAAPVYDASAVRAPHEGRKTT